jgi:hypothetical protein
MQNEKSLRPEAFFCDPAGTRTQGPNIKSVVLYQLSYEINLSFLGSAKIQSKGFCAKTFSVNYQQVY